MRSSFIILCFIALASLLAIDSCTTKKTDGHTAVKEWFNLQADSLLASLDTLATYAQQQKATTGLRSRFAESRYRYKQMEPIVEYYFQGLTKRINGPALPDIKTEDNQVFPPKGFQVIEQLIWDGYTHGLADSLINEIRGLQTDIRFVIVNFDSQTVLPLHVRQMIHHQLIRIGVLGITGFDAPVSQLSLTEAQYSLKGLKSLIGVYTEVWQGTLPLDTGQIRLFDESIDYLKAHPDFDTFDRLTFLSKHLVPLSISLSKTPLPATKEDSLYIAAFSGTLNDLLQGKGFNPDYYATYAASKTNPDKVKLGALLFKDQALSKNNDMSCASCHQESRSLTDGLTKAANFAHGGSLTRNTPTIYYSALQASQFYDMRASNIENQVHDVIHSTNEFNFSSDQISKRLFEKPEYKLLTQQAFDKDTLSGYEIRNAIAAYIRSLNRFSSKFDTFIQGNTAALNSSEKLGFNLFAGKAKCATCHFVPVFNGTVPPFFTKSESEIIGVPEKPIWENAQIDPDNGRYELNQLEELRFAFKTPTVRNAAATAPYMHNGVYKTLDEVIDFYHVGGGVGIGIDLPFQTLPFDSLILDAEEKTALIDFLKTLTDQEY